MFHLKVQKIIDASHQLPDSIDLYTKACSRLHGHSYYFIVEFDSEKNDKHGMVIDFGIIKDIIVTNFDHRDINEQFLRLGYDLPTTAENIARVVYELIDKAYPELLRLQVSVCEGFKGQEQSSWVTYNEYE